MDYDFEIIFKQGKMNTNADAVSRIPIDSNKLKEMIPKNNINVITRNMKKQKEEGSNKTINKNNNKNKEATNKTLNTDMRTDHLHIWNATSISDIRFMHKLKFKIIEQTDVRNKNKNKRNYNKKMKIKKKKISKILKLNKQQKMK